ncbi:MAG: 4Fe-4S ferredoxin, iron-sulfur binding [Mucilaginibacter sp.]|nr:4Fe-4S ferredoxin, iron-sulfur binding [Mucilaginibacter sp.]
MTVVVTENCHGCRFTECVDVCPAACFHFDDTMLYVDPDECVDCMACIVVCPVKAIYPEKDVPEAQRNWIEVNRIRALELPSILVRQSPLPTAEIQRAELGL